MLCRLLRGQKYGQQIHLPKSQETNLLILLGDIEVIDDDNPAPPPETQHLSKGWRIETSGLANDKYVIAYHDGSGGVMKYERPPAPTRQYRWDPETQTESYVMIESDCPKELIEQFLVLTGGAPDALTAQARREAQAEKLRRELDQREADRKRQNSFSIALK